jgi:UDP-glucose 4-epimerase
MHIVVLGASGFVGTNLVDELSDSEHSVTACDIAPPTDLPPETAFQEVDITDQEAVEEAVHGADAVALLATHQLTPSLEEPRTNAEINVMGSLNVLEAARDHGVEKVFFPSASSILGSVDGPRAHESVEPDPRSPYGVTKHAVEEYLDVYNELYDLDYLVFRFFNVYGPHQHPDSGAFVPTVMSRLARGDGVYVTGEGQQARDFVYVRDITEFIIEGLERDDVSNEIVNMGYGEQVTLLDAIHTIADVVGVDPEIERRPERDDEIDNFCADTTKCSDIFGHSPDTDFATGLERTFQWMRGEIDLG